MKCTGPLDIIPDGKLLMDEESDGKIFSIKEKRRNMDWTLYFHEKSNVWFLGMMRIDQMIDMLEKDGNLNEHPFVASRKLFSCFLFCFSCFLFLVLFSFSCLVFLVSCFLFSFSFLVFLVLFFLFLVSKDVNPWR